MKYLIRSLFVFAITVFISATSNKESEDVTDPTQVVRDVDPSLFQTANQTLSTVSCTLSNGTVTKCLKVATSGIPTDHQMGPWCPTNISDGADKGGIWLENGKVYDVDGDFIKNMATFYKDATWNMYDASGNIYRTKTQEDCAKAANPNVGNEYKNYCVECLPSYVTSITQTYLIPITPVDLSTPVSFGGAGGPLPDNGQGPPRGGRPAGGPPRGGPPAGGHGQAGPNARGIAFNGVRFDAPAPTNVILSAYTLAPFDDAGGHINLNAGYHYHAATGMTKQVAQSDGHAAMIGYAMDGYGMYERLDPEGKEPTDLDDCRGHTDETRGYHYHVAAPGTNSFINCLKGAYAK